MIFAVIDLGTNTFNLLIAKALPDNNFSRIFNTKIPVKLGEGTINQNFISDIPFHRGLNALTIYKQYITEYKVDKIIAIATSAIRSASNGRVFVETVKEKLDIDITVIDGNQEAELIYFGNRMAAKMTDDVSLIMDIGGGSTEFILANKNNIFWKKSYLLGASRLLQKFKPSDPINEKEIKDFSNYLNTELLDLWENISIYKPTELIGSSGAFDSVIDLIASHFNTISINENSCEYQIDISHYHQISKLIKASTLNERYSMKGLIEMRADMMVISVLLIDVIIASPFIKKFRATTFSLKEGAMHKYLGIDSIN
jgi:exopolyphosphatase/guanosine-5'-triphosphate,3'-diphosphate pyrophosphatase